MPERKEFAHRLASLPLHQIRLLRLYREALRLEGQGQNHSADRIRAVERALGISLIVGRRRDNVLGVEAADARALQRNFGISEKWLVDGEVEALRDGIEKYGRRMRRRN